MSALRQAAERMAAATGISFTLGEPGGDVTFDVVIDPAETCEGVSRIGCVYARVSYGEIQAVRIVFLNPEILALRRAGLLLHEMGHGLGLQHSLRASDLMGAGWMSLADFTDAEWLMIRMMLQRPGGNRFPDDDAWQSVGAGEDRTGRLICVL